MSHQPISGPHAEPLVTEYSAFMRVVQSVFVAAYAQGQFDQDTGFNCGTSLDEVATQWLEDHRYLFEAPVDVQRLAEKLASEADADRRRTNL